MNPDSLDPTDAGFSDIDPVDEEHLADMLGTQIDHTTPSLDAPEMDVDNYTPEPALSAVGTPIPVGKKPEPLQCSAEPSYGRPSTIPEDAEIIDLDSYECKNPFVHSSSLSMRIKVEERMSSYADARAQGQAPSPDRNGNDGMNPGGPSDVIMLDNDEEIQDIKREPIDHQPRQDIAFDWREMSKEIFEISDDDDEVVVTKEVIGQSPSSIFGPHTNGITLKGPSAIGIPWKSTSPHTASSKEGHPNGAFPYGAPTDDSVMKVVPSLRSTDLLGIPRTYLCAPKPKPTVAHLAKVEQIQKKLAERITGKPVVSGAGGIFRQPRVVNPDAPLPEKSRKDDGGIPDENDHAWMEEISSDSDDDDTAYVLIVRADDLLLQRLTW